MRIGVDATCWLNRRGYGRFTRALLSAALQLDRRNKYVFFVDGESEEFPFPPAVTVTRVESDVPTVQAAGAQGRRSLRSMWSMSRALSSKKLDLVFFPSVYSYVPLTTRAPKLVTVHDVIAEMFPSLVFPTRRSKFFWWAKVKAACIQARLVLTVSDYSLQCLAQQLKIPVSRMRVVSEASDPAFRRLQGQDRGALFCRLRIPESARLLTYLGGFSPHKNLSLLVDVFRELQGRQEFSAVYLVLVGDYQGDVFYSCYKQLLHQVREYGLQERVVFTGYLGDEEVVQLLNLSEALLLPSFCEGFGLPAVEAAACGTPAVVTTRSPLPELLGEGAIAVDPLDRAGWQEAITRILSDPRKRELMRSAGLTAARQLSWENSARQLLSAFEEVVSPSAASS